MSTRATARAHAPAPHRARPQGRPHPGPRPRPQAAPRRAPRSGRASRPRLRVGLLVIPIIALLLAGIVWINVSKLAFTAETGRVVERSRAVEAQNLRLKAQLDRANATVIDRAQDRLDMGMPLDASVTPLLAPARP